jgi:hypothetical protein
VKCEQENYRDFRKCGVNAHYLICCRWRRPFIGGRWKGRKTDEEYESDR